MEPKQPHSSSSDKPSAPQKQTMTSWILLGAMLVLVGGLLTVWVVRYDESLAEAKASGESANLPLGDFTGGLKYIGQLWDEKTQVFANLFMSEVEQSATGDEQNQGQVGQLTNAGLTNEQIETIEEDLFENVAPQE